MMVEGTVMSAAILETFIPFALHDFREKYPVIHIPMNSFWDKEKINIPRKKYPV